MSDILPEPFWPLCVEHDSDSVAAAAAAAAAARDSVPSEIREDNLIFNRLLPVDKSYKG